MIITKRMTLAVWLLLLALSLANLWSRWRVGREAERQGREVRGLREYVEAGCRGRYQP